MVKYNTLKLDDHAESCDEDSCNYLESESETVEEFEFEDGSEEIDYKSKIPEFIYSKNLLYILLSFILLVSSLFLKNHFFEILVEKKAQKISYQNLFVFLSFSVICVVFLGSVFDRVSMHYLKKVHGNTSNLYYFNELSYFLALLLVFISQSAFLYQIFKSTIIIVVFNINFDIQYCYRIGIFAIFIMGCLKGLLKYVSMRFNYNMYIKNIRKTILLDVFMNLIVQLVHKVPEEFCNEEIVEVPDESELNLDVKNGFILEKRYRIESACDLGFQEKRVIIKEFLNLVPTNFKGELPTIIVDIRKKAKYKSGKIEKNMKKKHRLFYVKHLKSYFKQISAFNYMLKQLNIEPDVRLDRKKLTELYEKYYRDLIMISQSLEQINSAIEIIYKTTQFIIFIIAVLMICISSEGEIGFLSGVVSTILGTQVVAKILSDNVIQSIIFLFIIHPFDIGDRILININGTIENLIVAELNVFSTSFFRWDGTFMFIPNLALINIPITNIRRSNSIRESHSIAVSSKTNPENLQKLKELLKRFCIEKKELFTDFILVNFDKIEDSKKLFIKVIMQYQSNFQHYEYYLHKRGIFISELERCLKILKINYKPQVQKVKVIDKSQKII